MAKAFNVIVPVGRQRGDKFFSRRGPHRQQRRGVEQGVAYDRRHDAMCSLIEITEHQGQRKQGKRRHALADVGQREQGAAHQDGRPVAGAVGVVDGEANRGRFGRRLRRVVVHGLDGLETCHGLRGRQRDEGRDRGILARIAFERARRRFVLFEPALEDEPKCGFFEQRRSDDGAQAGRQHHCRGTIGLEFLENRVLLCAFEQSYEPKLDGVHRNQRGQVGDGARANVAGELGSALRQAEVAAIGAEDHGQHHVTHHRHQDIKDGELPQVVDRDRRSRLGIRRRRQRIRGRRPGGRAGDREERGRERQCDDDEAPRHGPARFVRQQRPAEGALGGEPAERRQARQRE
jgi:hypothetical protein